MKNLQNISVDQMESNIPQIKIDDRYASSTGSKIWCKVNILKNDGTIQYVIERTRAGKYLMQK